MIGNDPNNSFNFPAASSSTPLLGSETRLPDFEWSLRTHPIFKAEIQPAGAEKHFIMAINRLRFHTVRQRNSDLLPPSDTPDRIYTYLMGIHCLDDLNITTSNAKKILKFVKTLNWTLIMWNEVNNSSIAFEEGRDVALRSKLLKVNTTLTTHEVFLKTLLIKNIDDTQHWADSNNWIPERAAQREHTKRKEFMHAIALSRSGRLPVIMGPRGNSASGKTTYILSALNGITGILSPDNFKWALKHTPLNYEETQNSLKPLPDIKYTEIFLNIQVHAEGTALYDQVLSEIKEDLNTRYAIDQRLLRFQSILEDLIEPAEKKGCPVILHDFENSSIVSAFLRMLTRPSFGQEPAQTKAIIIGGYIQAIENRSEIIKLVKIRDVVKEYKLFFDKTLVAEKKDSEWFIYDQETYTRCVELPQGIAQQIEDETSQIITKELLDDAVLRGYIYPSQIPMLEPWMGLTLAEAVERNAYGVSLSYTPLKASLSFLENFVHVTSSDYDHRLYEFILLCRQFVDEMNVLALEYEQFQVAAVGCKDIALGFAVEAHSLNLTLSTLSRAVAIAAKMYCQMSAAPYLLRGKEKRAFFGSVRESLFPMIQNLQHLLNRRNAFSGFDIYKSDSAAHLQVGFLNELLRIFSGNFEDPSIGPLNRSNRESFINIIKRGKKTWQKYKNKLRKIEDYVGGHSLADPVIALFEIKRYLKSTLKFIEKSREEIVNGYFCEKPLFPLPVTYWKPSYATGPIYRALGGLNKFPPLLPHLSLATSTFIKFLQKLIHDDSTRAILPILKYYQPVCSELLGGINEQLELFDKIDVVLTDLCESYSELMQELHQRKQDNESRTKEIVFQKSKKNSDRFKERLRQPDTLVGKNMFFLSHMINKAMHVKTHSNKICSSIESRERFQSATNPFLAAENWLRSTTFSAELTPRIKKGCRAIKTHTAKTILAAHQESIPFDTSLNYSPKSIEIKYNVWCGAEGNFHSDFKFDAMPKIPFLGSYFFTTQSNPIGLPSFRPLIYLKTSFFPTDHRLHVFSRLKELSFLSKDDIKRIPVVDEALGSNRLKLMTDALDLICLPSAVLCLPPPVENDNWPIVYLPKTYVDSLIKAFCPEYDKILLTGNLLIPTYSFIKGQDGYYRLQYEFVCDDGKGAHIFQSVTILEVSCEAVEAFYDQRSTGNTSRGMGETKNKIEFSEFLYCMLFSGHYEHEGMPNSNTYINEEKGIIAAEFTPFIGLYEIYKKFPGYKFIFNHRTYNHEAMLALDEAWRTGIINEQAQMFFEKIENVIHPLSYFIVQNSVHKTMASMLTAENSLFPKFKKNHTNFIALARLLSGLSEEKLNELLRKKAQIIPLDSLGGFENADFYAPTKKENIAKILSVINTRPYGHKNILLKQRDELIEIGRKISSSA